ncbi:hypothetical protein BKA67DRAFT_640529 [Truncatella angustata]|uniref:Uncharacterized protein n=1 Tax=Truncatella angustata TaxID=152316 RepID=A0A9P8UVQ1_9PEZI|nr:uncharacterized protein BKA67DRAFT_640529 [Truncatella angustata]KAH6659233.1 hypothetical protein BKA67DRAFT_640529 [Truncatella angustata]
MSFSNIFSDWYTTISQVMSTTNTELDHDVPPSGRQESLPAVAHGQVKETPSYSDMESFLPNVLELLQSPRQANQPFDFHCTICMKMLDISDSVGKLVAGMQSKTQSHRPGTDEMADEGVRTSSVPKSLPDFYDAHDLEETCVLPCGHILGYSCAFKWQLKNHMLPESQQHRHSPHKNGHLHCLLCGPQRFEDCGHSLQMIDVRPLKGFLPRYPGKSDIASTLSRLSMEEWRFDPLSALEARVPLTKPEGGVTPSSCLQCNRTRLRYITNVDWQPICRLCLPGPWKDRDGRGVFETKRGHDHMQLRTEYLDSAWAENILEVANIVWPQSASRDPVKVAKIEHVHREARELFVREMLGERYREFRERFWRRCSQGLPSYAFKTLIGPRDVDRSFADKALARKEHVYEQSRRAMSRASPGWHDAQQFPTGCRYCSESIPVPMGFSGRSGYQSAHERIADNQFHPFFPCQERQYTPARG